MKRKIRKRRQLRLKKFKEDRIRNQSDNEWYARELTKLFNSHPYWITASLSYYAFIYVDYHYGWEMYHPIKLMFLFDRMSQELRYGQFILEYPDDIKDYRYKSSFKELGSVKLKDVVYIDDMIRFKPRDIKRYFDVSDLEIIIKSGSQQRFVYIQTPEKEKYEPYKWLFGLIDDIINTIPREYYIGKG